MEKNKIKTKTLLYYELESRLVVGIYSDILRVLGFDLGLSGNIKQIIIKCFVRQVFNFEGGGVAHKNVESCCCKSRPN
jgi:hypothetical protein